MNKQEILRRIIPIHALALKIDWADPVALLGAIAEVESAFGLHARPRHERAYDYGGFYWSKSGGAAYDWRTHGSLSAMSFGSFQIMFPVAVELGFPMDRCPLDLQDDEVAIHWVIEYIRKRMIERGVRTVKQAADAYNTGSHRDSIHNNAYEQKFEIAYAGVVAKYRLDGRVV